MDTVSTSTTHVSSPNAPSSSLSSSSTSGQQGLENTSTRIEVIPGGYVELLGVLHCHESPEVAICKAARVSHGGDRSKHTPQQDIGLINYLMEHYHTSPFEHVEFSFYIRLPYYVNTQFLRHRTANINAESRRYRDASLFQDSSNVSSPSDSSEDISDRRKTHYWHTPVSKIEDVRIQHKSQHQGSYVPQEVSEREEKILALFQEMEANTAKNWELYKKVIAEGGAKELARVYLPEATFTTMYWKMDLHNLLHFLRLRLSPDSQLEIRKYAEAILELITPHVPNVIQAFRKFRLDSVTLSKKDLEGLDIRIGPEYYTKREIEKLTKKLDHCGVLWSVED